MVSLINELISLSHDHFFFQLEMKLNLSFSVSSCQGVTSFFISLTFEKCCSIGVPSKSFLSAHAHSMLFDSEMAIFNEPSLDDNSRGGLPMFCEIRGKYQSHGKMLTDKASDWL